MDLNGFLTFISIVVAILTVSSDATRRRLTFAWKAPAAVSALAFMLVLFYQHFGALAPVCQPHDQLCSVFAIDPAGKLPGTFSFLIVLLWLAFFCVWLIASKRIPLSKLPRLTGLVSELISERRFKEAKDIIAPNVPAIREAESSKEFQKIGLDSAPDEFLLSVKREKAFIEYLCSGAPSTACQMARVKCRAQKDYVDVLLQQFLANPNTTFYRELIELPQANSADMQYKEKDPVHYWLLSDAEFGEDLAVYQPVGDYVLRLLSPGSDADFLQRINAPIPGPASQDAGSSPIAVAVWFFDTLVRLAAFQGVQWHMWLYYFHGFTRGLLENYSLDAPRVDMNAEWATRTEYYLHQIIETLIGWIRLVERLPKDSVHRKFENLSVIHQNDNIPKSAAICLGFCLHELILSDQLRARFKLYILEIVLRALRDYRNVEGAKDIWQVASSSILEGGGLSQQKEYGERLAAIFDQQDHVLRMDLKNFRAELREKYGV